MIYLCKPDRTILGMMTGLKEETVSLTKHATDFYELTFSVDRYIGIEDGKLEQTDYYDSIDELMYLYQDDEQIYYIIDSEPTTTTTGIQETKSVTAHSCEVELNHKYLSNFKINCGTDDSLERLAIDAQGNYYNINQYTNLPNEYISFVNYSDHQLSLMHLALENTDWTVADDIPEDICKRKYSFESSDDIYTFLMKTVVPTARVIFQYDRKNKKISIVEGTKYGDDTGIFVSMRNLLQTVDVSSSNSDNLKTKIIPTGNDDLGILYVNFGQNYILNLDYFMNTENEYGDYKFVSEELHNKYDSWMKYRGSDIYKDSMTRRKYYAYLTKEYNQTMLKIDELKNRVPNDGTSIDYKTWKYDELDTAHLAYVNAQAALITLYKNQYHVIDIGTEPDYIPTPPTATSIKDTDYWIDFYSYKQIIAKVEEALKIWCKTDAQGNLIYDEQGNYIYLESGNPYYYADTKLVKEVDAWLYEWSLYGYDELQAKITAWNEAASILFNETFIKTGTVEEPLSYLEATHESWISLPSEVQQQWTSESAFLSQLNAYLDYMSYEVRENSLTKTNSIGIIRQAQVALAVRGAEIEAATVLKDALQTERTELANAVILENYEINGVKVFTEEDLAIIRRFIREYSYSNTNYLITNLDDIATMVDAEEELYQDAYEELYEKSQPQYNFSTSLSNLFALKEFEDYKKDFKIGNFIRVALGKDQDQWVKLRLMSMTYNPVIPTTGLSVEFSTMTKTLDGMSDLAMLLSLNENGTSSSGSSSSSSSSSGVVGTNDAEITIANSILNAMLQTVGFKDTVNSLFLESVNANYANFTTLISHSALFDNLEVTGDMVIGGQIKSNNYDITAKTGSMLDLTQGTFDFAGGGLVWDGSNLYVNGYATQIALDKTNEGLEQNTESINGLADGTTKVSGSCMNAGVISNGKGSTIDLDNNELSLGNGALSYTDETGLVIEGSITAEKLTATESGQIACWKFDANQFYKGDILNPDDPDTKRYEYQFGNDGLDIGENFRVNINGDCTSNALYSDKLSTSSILVEDNFSSPWEQSPIGGIDPLVTISPSLVEVSSGGSGGRAPGSVSESNVRINTNSLSIYDLDVTTAGQEYSESKLSLNGNGINGTVSKTTTDASTATSSTSTESFKFGSDGIVNSKAYENVSLSNQKTLYIGDDGTIAAVSSSRRYKQDIENVKDVDPHGLYNLPVVQYRYKKEYGGGDNSQLHIGFIAEDVAEYYPIAARTRGDGQIETYEICDIVPAMLKLIQEQHNELEALKNKINELSKVGGKE